MMSATFEPVMIPPKYMTFKARSAMVMRLRPVSSILRMGGGAQEGCVWLRAQAGAAGLVIHSTTLLRIRTDRCDSDYCNNGLTARDVLSGAHPSVLRRKCYAL